MRNIPEALKHLKVVQGRITRTTGNTTRLYAVLQDGTVVMAEKPATTNDRNDQSLA